MKALRLGLTAGLCLTGALALLGWAAQAWGERQAGRPQVRVEVTEAWGRPETRGSAKLSKGKVIVLDGGQPERWRAVVEHSRNGVKVLKKMKRLSKGRPMRVMLGRSDKDDPVPMPKVTRAYASLLVQSTAYDPGPGDNGDGNAALTVTGARARFGVVAVDPLYIPYKSLLYIEGYGPGLALDRGGAIKGKRVDLCFNSTREAEEYGRKRTRVHILSALSKDERAKVLAALALPR